MWLRALRISVLWLLAAGVPVRAAIYSSPVLWQVGGYALDDFNALFDGPPILSEPNPALPTPPGVTMAIRQQLQTGSARETSTKAVPRNTPWLPQAAGVAGHWHELDWRVGFQQRFNAHEQYNPPTNVDTVWQDFDSRLEAMTFQGSAAVLPGQGWRPDVRLGVGYSRFRLVVDQLEVQRKLLADAWQGGVQLVWPNLRVGLGYEQKTVWNHWDTVTYYRWGESLDTVQVWGVLPASFHLESDIYLPAGWRAGVNVRWTDWSSSLLGLRDRTEAALLVHQDLQSVGLRLHGGVCTSGSTAATGSQLEWLFQDEQSTWFLLAGVERDCGPLTAELKLADSHMGQGKSRKQTLLQLGLRYSLPTR